MDILKTHKKLTILIYSLFAVALLLLHNNSFAQDIQFSQFYNNKILIAPSFAGSTNGSRFGLNYRDQWSLIPKRYRTYDITFDHYFQRLKSGLGVYILHDGAGEGYLTNTNIAAMYSFKFKIIKKWKAQPGLKFSYSHRSIDMSNLTFGDQLSFYGIRPFTIENKIDERIGYFDFGTSILFHNPRNWVGFGVDHLGLANASMSSGRFIMPLKYSAFAGIRLKTIREHKVRGNVNVTMYMLYKKQGKSQQFDLGAIWTQHPLYFGAFYRGLPVIKTVDKNINHDAIEGVVGLLYNDWDIAYSYDFTVSKLVSTSGGSHEISITYIFNQKDKTRAKKIQKELKCPQTIKEEAYGK